MGEITTYEIQIEKPEENISLEDLDRRIILKCFFEKWGLGF